MPEWLGVVKIALTNKSEADSAAFPLLAQALKQFLDEYSQDWDLGPAEVRFAADGVVPPDHIEAVVLQTPDVDGALAYHDRDEQGNPRIKAFYGLVPGGELFHGPAGDGGSLLGELQHEGAETWSDLFANIYTDLTIADPQGSGKIYRACALETEDPVQEIADAFTVQGQKCDRTNYVLPRWFDPDASKGTKVDRIGVLPGPATVAAGGYVIVREAYAQDGQIFARHLKLDHHVPMQAWRARKKEHISSRTARRLAKVVRL